MTLVEAHLLFSFWNRITCNSSTRLQVGCFKPEIASLGEKSFYSSLITHLSFFFCAFPSSLRSSFPLQSFYHPHKNLTVQKDFRFNTKRNFTSLCPRCRAFITRVGLILLTFQHLSSSIRDPSSILTSITSCCYPDRKINIRASLVNIASCCIKSVQWKYVFI